MLVERCLVNWNKRYQPLESRGDTGIQSTLSRRNVHIWNHYYGGIVYKYGVYFWTNKRAVTLAINTGKGSMGVTFGKLI